METVVKLVGEIVVGPAIYEEYRYVPFGENKALGASTYLFRGMADKTGKATISPPHYFKCSRKQLSS